MKYGLRIVERTTCTGGVAVFPIPGSVIQVEYVGIPLATLYYVQPHKSNILQQNGWMDMILGERSHGQLENDYRPFSHCPLGNV